MQGVKLISEKSGLPEDFIDKILRQRFLSVVQVAELLNKSVNYIRSWIHRSRLDVVYPYRAIVKEGPQFIVRNEKLIEAINQIYGTNIIYKPPDISDDDSMKMFITRFNKARKAYGKGIGKNFRDISLDTVAKRKFRTAIKSYNVNQMIVITMTAFKDKYHIDNEYQYITPEHILRPAIMTRFYANANLKKNKE